MWARFTLLHVVDAIGLQEMRQIAQVTLVGGKAVGGQTALNTQIGQEFLPGGIEGQAGGRRPS